jgi:hypothetical protein
LHRMRSVVPSESATVPLPDHDPLKPVNGPDWAWITDTDNMSAAPTPAALIACPNNLEPNSFISNFPIPSLYELRFPQITRVAWIFVVLLDPCKAEERMKPMAASSMSTSTGGQRTMSACQRRGLRDEQVWLHPLKKDGPRKQVNIQIKLATEPPPPMLLRNPRVLDSKAGRVGRSSRTDSPHSLRHC